MLDARSGPHTEGEGDSFTVYCIVVHMNQLAHSLRFMKF